MNTPVTYIKKPIVVEACKLTSENYPYVEEWVIRNGGYMRASVKGAFINTLEGIMYANFGDYIIQGIKGEFYPCRSDIFKETYDPYVREEE